MTTSLNSTVVAREIGYGVVQTLRKRITFADRATTVTVGKMPAGSSIVSGGVHVITAFNDTGADTLDVGFIGSTTDADGYATALLVSAVGFIVLDELAATTNIQGTVEHTVTCLYTGANSDPSAGVADVIINFVTPYSGT